MHARIRLVRGTKTRETMNISGQLLGRGRLQGGPGSCSSGCSQARGLGVETGSLRPGGDRPHSNGGPSRRDAPFSMDYMMTGADGFDNHEHDRRESLALACIPVVMCTATDHRRTRSRTPRWRRERASWTKPDRQEARSDVVLGELRERAAALMPASPRRSPRFAAGPGAGAARVRSSRSRQHCA